MKKVIASAGLLALGAAAVQTVQGELAAGAEKPWSISGTLRGFYDDNINTQPNGPGRVSSFGFEVRPSISVNPVLEQTTLNLSYIYDLRYYSDRATGKTDQSHDFELFLNHNFSERYSLDLSDSFVIAQEPEVLDPSLSAVQRSNGNNIRNNGSINFHAQLTRLLGIVLGYSNTFYDYEENAGNTVVPGQPSRSALLDRMEHLVTFNTRWTITDTTTGIVGYQFGAVVYNSNESIQADPLFPFDPFPGYPFSGPFFIAPNTRNNYSHYVYIGAEHSFSSSLSASGRAGIQYVDYYNILPGNPGSEISPYVDLSLNYGYMDGGNLILGFHHSHNQTDLGAASATSITEDQESSSVYGSIIQKLTPISPSLVATLTAQYQNSVFHGGPSDGMADNFFLLGLNLAYQFNHYMSAEVGYNYDLLSSEVIGRGYDRNRVYIGMTATY